MNKEPNDFDFFVTNCDISDIVTEINRFMFHIILIHVITCSIDTKEKFFGIQLYKTLFVTVLAVIIYHTIFKKIVNGKLKKIQSYCNPDDNYNNNYNNNNIKNVNKITK